MVIMELSCVMVSGYVVVNVNLLILIHLFLLVDEIELLEYVGVILYASSSFFFLLLLLILMNFLV